MDLNVKRSQAASIPAKEVCGVELCNLGMPRLAELACKKSADAFDMKIAWGIAYLSPLLSERRTTLPGLIE